MATLYVNPDRGNDNATGSPTAPLKTLTRALQKAQGSTTIRLSSGTYDLKNGEKFPLIIPAGVIILGQETTKGRGILIQGSGEYRSTHYNLQQVTLLPADNTQLRGVSITNPAEKGTGVWIESTAPTLSNNTFVRCSREGIFISGKGKPLVQDNYFESNRTGGIFFVRNGKGEIRRNRFQSNGYGIIISDDAAPLLWENQFVSNYVGIYLSRNARPVLRHNQIENNRNGGLVITGTAQLDFGSRQDPAGNTLRNNSPVDLRNDTSSAIISAGNQLSASRVQGSVRFETPIVDAPKATGLTPFPDVSGHWAETFIAGLVTRNLIRGFPDGTFKPNAGLTRAEYAALIATTFNFPRQVGRRGTFRDVARSFWGAAAIQKSAEMGFIAGFPDLTFRPQNNLTRVQALLSLVSGLGLTGGDPNSLSYYRDRAQIPSYATNALSIATQRRLVVNYPQVNRLNPLANITRGEISALLYQALVATGKATAIDSSYIVSPNSFLLSFVDIQSHWAQEFIRRLASLELVSGFADGTFKPDQTLNRAQYASLVAKVFNPPPKRPATQFIDIPQDFWARNAIQQTYRAGFLSGFPDRTFHPEQNLRRVHLIVSLVNGLGLSGAKSQTLEIYQDRKTIPQYACSAVAAATQAKIVVSHPDPTKLQSFQDVTRGEAIAMVYQVLAHQGKINSLDSPYIV